MRAQFLQYVKTVLDDPEEERYRVRLNGDEGVNADGITPAVKQGTGPDAIDVILKFGAGTATATTQTGVARHPRGSLERIVYLWLVGSAAGIGFDELLSASMSIRALLEHARYRRAGSKEVFLVEFVQMGEEQFGPKAQFLLPQQQDVYKVNFRVNALEPDIHTLPQVET